MANSNKKNNFILQAGILAAAGIISRIIGLLYRSPLVAVIGDEGNGYYQAAYNIYTMILLISSYSIPSAISRVIAQKLAVREYRNAHRIFICSFWYVIGAGGLAACVLFFGADLLVQGEAAAVVKVLAPTVLFSGMLGVVRGYFQAHKSMVQTSVSQIMEQIVNAVVSVGAAWLLIDFAMGTVEMGADAAYNTKRAVFGASGSALGTGAGVLTALLFMWGVYALNRSMIRNRIQRDKSRNVESYGQISKMILMVVTPFILSTAIYNLSTPLNQTIYVKLMYHWKELEESVIYYNYGIFSGKATTVSNIPIAFASAMAAAMLPSVTQMIARREIETAREKIGLAVKTTMLISIPSAVGLFVLAKPVMTLLFNQKDTLEMAYKLLMGLSLSVIFYAYSTLNSSILQGMGKVNKTILNAGIALVVQTIVLVVILVFTDWDLYGLAISATVYSGTMCVLNQWAVRKAIGYRQEVARTFLIPLGSAGFMGAVAWAVYEGMYLLTSSNVISLIPAVLLGSCVYFAMLVGLRGVTEQELRSIPKGHLLVKIAKKCRLLK